MQSKAKTVEQYLAELPEDRRKAINAVREVILKNLDKSGYEEGMGYGMISYHIPHRIYPAGYHCDPSMPVPYAGLASQKNYMSVYLMSIYGDGETWFRDEWAKTGKKKPDMGKCCVRFKSIDDIPLELIGRAIKSMPAKKYLEYYETMRNQPRERPVKSGKKVAKKAPAKKAAEKKTTKKKTAKKAAKKTRSTGAARTKR
jgi:hypothetical protein